MPKFKVGDTVRATVDSPNSATWIDKGDIGEVLSVEQTGQGKNYYDVSSSKSVGPYLVLEEHIELVENNANSEEVSPRAALLREAESLITGDRNNQYGPPTQDFARTAEFWTTYLGDKLKDGVRIQAHDIAVLMTLLKISRITWTANKKDSWADAAGYIGCGWECAVDEGKEA